GEQSKATLDSLVPTAVARASRPAFVDAQWLTIMVDEGRAGVPVVVLVPLVPLVEQVSQQKPLGVDLGQHPRRVVFSNVRSSPGVRLEQVHVLVDDPGVGRYVA